jgi:F0F1-type ATP synthase assembly protein I
MSHWKPVNLLPRKRTVADDNLGRGIEFALLTVVFLGAGYGLDRWLDTKPAFTIGLVLVGLVGQALRFHYAYEVKMERLEAERREMARSQRA